VESITYDQDAYKAVVRMHISGQYSRIPDDSDASIMTAGLLGGQYIGVTVGGSDKYLKEGSKFAIVQDALVLENLINQLVASFAGKKSDSAEESK
jgi:phospholipid/cholesterol/gamma-HCH transport system substrate-binding protein